MAEFTRTSDLKLDNVFASIPPELDSEVFENLVQQGDLKIERIVSRGHCSAPGQWYDQNHSEWVIVLQGEAIISLENADDCHLLVGSYLNLPAHTRHRVKWTTPDIETVWLAVHY